MIKQCCWRNHSVVKNNDNEWVEWKLFLDSVRIWNADLKTKFLFSILRYSVSHWCRERLSLAKSSETRVKSDRIHSVRFEAALINLSERYIIIYATAMIKACRCITRIGNSIPLNDCEKQFSCFVWVAVFFFSFFWLFFSLRIQPCLFAPCSSPRNVPGGEKRE